MKQVLAIVALAALAGCSKPAPNGAEQKAEVTSAAATAAPAPLPDVPAGAYKLDPAHASLIFKVNHVGASNYTARFRKFDAQLQFDPQRPEASSVSATIDVASLETDYPEPEKLDFNKVISGKDWLGAPSFPQMTFRSTRVEVTGPRTARITGDLSLKGITHPVVLDATFNGGYPAGGMDPSGARIGFSAQGSLKRSDFGIKAGIPAPGSTMGVGDAVQVIIEAEFTQPAAAAPAAPKS